MKKAAKNRGFTLVELIVVVAVIAVLAAILVPTLMGVVSDSRIATADEAASKVKNSTMEFLYKMNLSDGSYIGEATKLKIAVTDGSWAVEVESTDSSGVPVADNTSDWLDGVDHWGRTAGSAAGTAKQDTEYAAYMANRLSDIRTAYIEVYIRNGTTVGVTFLDGANLPLSLMPAENDFVKQRWGFGGSTKPGMCGNIVVGTFPKLSLDDSAT